MDFFNNLKKFFNLPSTRTDTYQYRERDRWNGLFSEEDESSSEYRPPINNHDDFMNFNVFSNPLEMHRYFEHQMNELLRSFGMVGEDSFFGNSDSFFGSSDSFNDHAIEEQQPIKPGSLRDQYLKPGYQKTVTEDHHKVDGDIDGKVNLGDLDSVLKGESSQITPYRSTPKTQFFGQSITSKTIRNADGTMETHRTIKDRDGNEETTVTRKRGDQEYSVTTRKDKHGREEKVENYVNLKEEDIDEFLKKGLDKPLQPFDSVDKLPTNWFPFDKFFK